MIRKIVTLSLPILIILLPLFSIAIEPDDSGIQQAIVDATRDAKKDANFPLWFAAGCVFNVFGVGASYLIVPSPEPSRFLGKPPAYINAYVHQYKKVIRSRQTMSAFAGCVTMTGTALIIAIISSAHETNQNNEGCSCSLDDPFGLNSCLTTTNDCLEGTNTCLTTGEGCSVQGGSCLESSGGCLGGGGE